jgi:signal transduction histidine kinase
MMERMRVLVGAVCGMILLPSRGEYQGLHAVSALCGLPRDVFARRYKLPVEMLEKMSSARGLIEYVDEQPGPIRQSINEYDAAVGARIDKLFLIKMDFRGLGEGVLVYFINNQEDVARGSLKIDNGDSIERSVLAQFAGAISLAFNNRRINERSMRFRNERRQWLEQVSHQIVQSIGVVRTSAHGITNWAIELGKINPHAYSEWSSDDIKFFFDRMDEVFYGSNNALRVAQNLKRSVFNPRDEKNIDWEWEIEPDVPGLLIQIARDFQAMAKEYGLRRLHVETVGLSQLNDRLNLISTEELFRQAVANLLENAVKYSYRGGEIIVDGQLAGNQGIIDITNEGIQLLADDIERIFEYGYRSPQAIKRNAPGTGIGLKVARDIIEFHGGKLTAKPSVRSERMLEGKITWLTTFTIHLPLQKQR